MRKIVNGIEYEVPKGFVVIATPMIELIDKGDIALFRDGDQRPVEFVAAMPDDMYADYLDHFLIVVDASINKEMIKV